MQYQQLNQLKLFTRVSTGVRIIQVCQKVVFFFSQKFSTHSYAIRFYDIKKFLLLIYDLKRKLLMAKNMNVSQNYYFIETFMQKFINVYCLVYYTTDLLNEIYSK